ncbi:MAG: hypothetical protein KC609_06165, partial [Myxococcales bacterium]|nr:hypothetical protein [Myxococcales bacterium]
CIGIFGGDGATIGPIALRDEPAPGLDPSISLAGFFSEGLALSRDGKVAFRAYLKGPGVTGTNQTAIYFGASGTLALVARQGQSVDSTTLGALSPPSVNADGQVVFESANSVWLWSSDKGLARVAAVGGTLDGGGTITRIWDHPQLGANGRILIDAEIDDTPALLLWDGTLKVVVKVGDPAPGVDGTPSIASLHGINMLNAKGQVVFGGSLETDDVVITTENRDCLWITDPSGTPHLVLRTEGTLALGPFDVRQVTEWKLSEEDGETYGFGPRESGYPSSFNDKGELGVVVRFLDGLLAYVVSRVE